MCPACATIFKYAAGKIAPLCPVCAEAELEDISHDDSPKTCGKCRTPLCFMTTGQRNKTLKGHFMIKVAGYYCKSCGAGYGGAQ